MIATEQQWQAALASYAEQCRVERRDEFDADLEPERLRYAEMVAAQLD